ncbi:MAG: PD-(D/E)XK nuclease family protein [Clostridiaceae bacterium]|nr:PD-(D/E)XK nuclease family protein [Clostridiaceae bacterium]
MIETLADICRENLLLNKILLVPSYTAGRNIIAALAGRTSVLNLRIETIQSIAYELGMPLLAAGSETLANDGLSRQKMFAVIYNLQQNNEFEYFTAIRVTPSVSDSVWNAVMEIKYAGLNTDDISEDSFVCPEKGRDIKRIIREYDLMLENEGLTDYPGLIQRILKADSKEDALLLVPNSIKLRYLEKKLISEKFSSVRILYDEPINGIDPPASYYCPDYPEKKLPKSPFACLYAPGETGEDADISGIHLKKAYGESNETEAVLRDIKTKGIPFDNVCIYAATREPYAQLLYQKAMQLGIPVTFSYGISIQNSGPGKVFDAVIRWIGSDYLVSDLTKMLHQELIRVPSENGDTISPYQAANVLRASGIGWGRERYLPVLDEKLEALQKESPDDDYKLKRLKILGSVRKFTETVLNMIPSSQGQRVSLKELAKGIASFVNGFAEVKSELDAEAKKMIVETLNRVSIDLFIDTGEALRILDSFVRGLRIGVSNPCSGHIHLSDFDNGVYINRRHHYFIGLDADRFPGKTGEDPVLLDAEKQRLSDRIVQNREKPNESIYRLVELLAGLNGNITLSYSCLDPAENRDQMPSSFILQVYRMISNNSLADYSDLRDYFAKSEGYINGNAIDESSFWLSRCFNTVFAGSIRESVFECYPHLERGWNAWDNQGSTRFTCYDGYIGNLGIKTDGEVFSASRLELLAKCPYKYYLRYILNVSLPDELVYDPGTWLDPLQKGSLYHAVFELFYKTITEKQEKPSREGHSAVILQIAEDVIREYKKQVPPPNEIVFDIERREILESCLIFLAGEEENADGGRPVEFELAFGMDGEGYPPVEITLPSGRKFLLAGKIDRIDQVDGNNYRIIDYKSGGTYGFSDRDFFKKGKQIQHALYAYACEVLLKKYRDAQNAKVKEGVYLFPTKKGEGRRFIRVLKDLSKFFRLLDNLLTVIEEGTFAVTEDPGDCRWCDYQVVCRIHRLPSVAEEKRNDKNVEALAALRGLSDYE